MSASDSVGLASVMVVDFSFRRKVNEKVELGLYTFCPGLAFGWCKVPRCVVGSPGHTGITHLLVGSTAERVVEHAPCPVLVDLWRFVQVFAIVLLAAKDAEDNGCFHVFPSGQDPRTGG
jgi:hypothetical protein